MKVQALAATYTPISREEMEAFIRRGFRALKPKMSTIRGELVFDLYLSEKVGVRVWSSLGSGSSSAAAVGEDAIRVQFFHFAKGHPLQRGKAPIVKRTQGWKDNLKDRIEDIIEMYDDREDYWES